MTASAYEQLQQRFALLQKMADGVALLNVDNQKAIPEGSRKARDGQIIAISDAIHALISTPEVEEWLHRAEDDAHNLSPVDQRNLVLMRRGWTHEALLPVALASERKRLEIEGANIHTRHRKTGTWDDVKDWYAHSFDVLRECGQAKQEALDVKTPYEALLDEFSMGVREDMLDREFAVVDSVLPRMVKEAQRLQKKRPAPLPVTVLIPVAEQHELNTRLAEYIGFDFSRGRFVDADNYFTQGGRDDCYITTSYDEANIFDGLIMHEAGHGLYAQNLPAELCLQPVGNPMGMAVHEMTAMIIECNAASTPAFFDYLSQIMREIFNRHDDPAFTAANLRSINAQSKPSYIRMLADELTYPLHLTLRYELERDAIAGKIDVRRDMPDAWNEGFKKRFGIIPPDARNGCMQDQHWPTGSIGYFPDYILGRMGAAQMFAAAVRAHPTIAQGDLPALKNWMTENVYSKGSMLTLDQLFTQATGTPLNAQPLFNHLSQKFLGKPFKMKKQTRGAAPA